MKNVLCLTLCAALLFVATCVIPGSAVVLQVTVKGTVADVSLANNTLTISDPEQYGCDYGSGISAPVCSWTPLNTSTLTGTVPDAAALPVFAKADQVVAVSLGGTGGTWIALAKLYGSGASADYAIDEVGDIGSLPTALIGDYAITATTTPDCSACTGTTCTATGSNVTITSGTMTVAQKTLVSGESLFFNGRNDASSVNVTFMKGEALSESCPGYAGLIGGIQPVSDYIVHVVPPIGTSVTATHITDESAASPASTPSSLSGSAAVTTTPKSSLPFAGLCVLGLSIAVIAVQRRRD
ncbi:hypothetical protein [Methanoregula sp.]|jgi:hypothetical protein|uniref:hypothetical protein n=1 Tax=Methanoregula sp. TaxID=2052170 RepID=UPI0025CEF173|nr:hypothetical protein [Methanoregula sp.]